MNLPAFSAAVRWFFRHSFFGMVACIALVAGPSVVAASAQEFPTHAITLIYPFPPGSSSDLAWRLVADEAGKILGQRVIVENKPGASGRIGLEVALQSPHDGYMLGVANIGNVALQALIDPSLSLAPGKDYVSIVGGFEIFSVLTINPGAPYKNVQQFVDYAKAHPGQVKFALPGIGSGGHLATELFIKAAGITANLVPYQGEQQAIVAQLSGEVDALFSCCGILPYVQSDKLIPIAHTGGRPFDLMPNVPALKDIGYPTVVSSSWQGLVAPAGTPPAVVSKLHDAFEQAFKLPSVNAKLTAGGNIVMADTADAFTNYVNSELVRWKAVVPEFTVKMN